MATRRYRKSRKSRRRRRGGETNPSTIADTGILFREWKNIRENLKPGDIKSGSDAYKRMVQLEEEIDRRLNSTNSEQKEEAEKAQEMVLRI